MSLSIDDTLTLLEILVILMGIGLTWAAYYGSERAELPGEATIPDPNEVEEPTRLSEGRTLR
jgi:hypothetical protein